MQVSTHRLIFGLHLAVLCIILVIAGIIVQCGGTFFYQVGSDLVFVSFINCRAREIVDSLLDFPGSVADIVRQVSDSVDIYFFTDFLCLFRRSMGNIANFLFDIANLIAQA